MLSWTPIKDAVRVTIEHGGYGCECGCCKHWITVHYADGTKRLRGGDLLGHPDSLDESVRRAYVEELVLNELGSAFVSLIDHAGCELRTDEECQR